MFEDQLEAVAHTSKRKGHDGVDLALFTDGLRDEREQGITIDVATGISPPQSENSSLPIHQATFSTPRNMVTGASPPTQHWFWSTPETEW